MMDSRRRTGARMFRLLGTPRTTSQDEPRDAKADGDDAGATRVLGAGRGRAPGRGDSGWPRLTYVDIMSVIGASSVLVTPLRL